MAMRACTQTTPNPKGLHTRSSLRLHIDHPRRIRRCCTPHVLGIHGTRPDRRPARHRGSQLSCLAGKRDRNRPRKSARPPSGRTQDTACHRCMLRRRALLRSRARWPRSRSRSCTARRCTGCLDRRGLIRTCFRPGCRPRHSPPRPYSNGSGSAWCRQQSAGPRPTACTWATFSTSDPAGCPTIHPPRGLAELQLSLRRLASAHSRVCYGLDKCFRPSSLGR